MRCKSDISAFIYTFMAFQLLRRCGQVWSSGLHKLYGLPLMRSAGQKKAIFLPDILLFGKIVITQRAVHLVRLLNYKAVLVYVGQL